MGIRRPGEPCARCNDAEREVNSYCRPCHNRNSREGMREAYERRGDAIRKRNQSWRKANPQYFRRTKYGVTREEVAAMRIAQGDRCDICGDPLRWSENVDHDHDTGTVRGLLCTRCNPGLGFFRDDPRLLLAAAAYLQRWS